MTNRLRVFHTSDKIMRLSGGTSGAGMDFATALAIIEAHDKEV
jgi:hypothetical protein